ncbi:MAG: transglutaminase family protein [Spirochaetales bacterium]|nr:transglutaminase family protein [Spirochaetales bacterium]
MNDFLQPTIFCDFNHPDILSLAESLSGTSQNETETAIAVYHFVRDGILFKNVSPAQRASDVLAAGEGNCFAKAKLQISLLRACGIPSGYFLQEITAESMMPFFSEEALSLLGDPVLHVVCAVYLSSRWLKADATFDEEILNLSGCGGWKVAGRWDGHSDRVLPKDSILLELAGPSSYAEDSGDIPTLSEDELEITNDKVRALRLKKGVPEGTRRK